MTNYAVGGVHKASESLMHEVVDLQRKLDHAIETLKFYAS